MAGRSQRHLREIQGKDSAGFTGEPPALPSATKAAHGGGHQQPAHGGGQAPAPAPEPQTPTGEDKP